MMFYWAFADNREEMTPNPVTGQPSYYVTDH